MRARHKSMKASGETKYYLTGVMSQAALVCGQFVWQLTTSYCRAKKPPERIIHFRRFLVFVKITTLRNYFSSVVSGFGAGTG